MVSVVPQGIRQSLAQDPVADISGSYATFISMPGPLVSVVIPTYNRALYLSRAIQSVLAQTFRDLEIIIVDDASTDASAEVMAGIADSRVRVLKLSKNQGAAAARNLGIDSSRGKWVAFLDSDDEWKPRKLELQLRALYGQRERERLVGYCAFELTGSQLQKHGIQPDQHVGQYLFLEDGEMQTSTLIVPKALAHSVRFDPLLKRHQDWDFVLRLSKAGARFAWVGDALSIWHSDAPDRISKDRDSRLSQAWIEDMQARSLITPREALGFQLKQILPKTKGWKRARAASTLLIRACRVLSHTETFRFSRELLGRSRRAWRRQDTGLSDFR